MKKRKHNLLELQANGWNDHELLMLLEELKIFKAQRELERLKSIKENYYQVNKIQKEQALEKGVKKILIELGFQYKHKGTKMLMDNILFLLSEDAEKKEEIRELH